MRTQTLTIIIMGLLHMIIRIQTRYVFGKILCIGGYCVCKILSYCGSVRFLGGTPQHDI